MRTIRTDENGDWVFMADHSLEELADADAIAQTAAEFVKTLRGELIFRTDRGVRWDVILGPNTNATLAQGYIRSRLLEVPGVVAVPALEVTIANNQLTYAATIETVYGEAVLDGSV